jgi:hypothetical protein
VWVRFVPVPGRFVPGTFLSVPAKPKERAELKEKVTPQKDDKNLIPFYFLFAP